MLIPQKQSGVDRLCLSASRAIMYDVREGNAELDAALKSHDEFYYKNAQKILGVKA